MSARGLVVYVPGGRWNGVPGTDRRLVEALAEKVDVLWVEPPASFVTRGAGAEGGAAPSGVDIVAPGVFRVSTRVIPGASRPVLRRMADAAVSRRIRSAISTLGSPVFAIVVASPRGSFPEGVDGLRVLYVTDDWPAGAEMMGLARASVIEGLVDSLRRADLVAAVTPGLLSEVLKYDERERRTVVLPNGCVIPPRETGRGQRRPVAGLVGQLNERLDVDALEAVQARGIGIVVIGPRTERREDVTRRLDRFLGLPSVDWLGAVPPASLPAHLAHLSVGLTPYADSPFNRSSFPLKTLEYLASGLPVVSTDLPAVRELDTPDISVASDPQDFADQVEAVLTGGPDEAAESRRRAFAAQHSWGVRAAKLLDEVGVVTPGLGRVDSENPL